MVTSAGVYGGQATALAIMTQANTYLQQLYSGPGGSYYTSTAALLDATEGGQDQITAVPEPASALLLGLGFGLIVRRKFGRAAGR
jgi:hypothetical protein